MNLDERMSDTLSKWERLAKGSSLKDLKLVFKVGSVLNIRNKFYFVNILGFHEYEK